MMKFLSKRLGFKSKIKYHQSGDNVERTVYELVLKWGMHGVGEPGKIDGMRGIAIDQDNYVYIGDGRNERIQKFDAYGHFIRMWNSSQGATEENIFWVEDVDVGPDGNIYVATVRSEILKFDPDGNLLNRWNSFNDGKDYVSYAYALSVSKEGMVYVIDYNHRRIVVYDIDGKHVNHWKTMDDIVTIYDGPEDIVAGPNGYVYAQYSKKGIVRKFDLGGNILREYVTLGTQNTYEPKNMFVDDKNRVNIACPDWTIRAYGDHGELESEMILQFTPDEPYVKPGCTVIDKDGYIYTSYHDSILKFGRRKEPEIQK